MMTRATLRRSLPTLLSFGIAMTVLLGSAQAVTPTLGAWNDREVVSSRLGTVNCSTGATDFASRAAGKLIDGSIGATNLATIANLKGVQVQTTGATSVVTPSDATVQRLDGQTYANPLSVSALGAVNADLGGTLSFTGAGGAGALSSYARAKANGYAAGASGTITPSGAIGSATTSPAASSPAVAVIQLGTILSTSPGGAIATRITDLSDARLAVGAVASSATFNGCAAAWTQNVYNNLTREYLVSSVDAELNSPLVGRMLTQTSAAVATATTGIGALATNAKVTSSVQAAVAALVAGRLSTLSLGDVAVTSLNVDLNLAPVTALLSGTISDSSGLVTIDLSNGYASIDLAQLVNGTNGINGLAPNTPILVNAAMATRITQAVTEATTSWRTAVMSALTTALNNATISAAVTVALKLTTIPLAVITLTIPRSPLSAALAGTVVATSSVSLLGGTCNVTNPVACTVNTVVSAVLPPLVSGIGRAVATAATGAITATDGLFATLQAALPAFADPLIAFVARATTGLFGTSGALSLTANNQNLPNPDLPHGSAVPAWAASLPGANRATGSTGQYDVTALRLTLAGSVAGIDFARASVGPIASVR